MARMTDAQAMRDADDRVRASRRQGPRFAASVPALVYSGGFAGPLPARTRDLGPGGTCVETRSGFAYSAIGSVELDLPGGAVRLPARGRWQRIPAGDDSVLTGIAFEELDDTAEVRLWDAALGRGSEIARALLGRGDLEAFGIEEILGLCQSTRQRPVRAGQTIVREGAGGQDEDSIFIVRSGAVTLRIGSSDGRELGTVQLDQGRLFGGLALVAAGPHSILATALTDCTLVEITREAFEYLRGTRPWLALRLGEALVRAHGRLAGRLIEGAAAVPGGQARTEGR
jgi:CRP-like cAMP-binding protein